MAIASVNGKQFPPSGALQLLGLDFISGLELIWVSATALTVTTGQASRPSDGFLLQPAANIAKTGLSLTANTWYHVYLWLNGASPDIEIVTTAPAAAYFGTARAKTGDTTRRYIGSIKTDASSNIVKFGHEWGRGAVTYLQDINTAPLRLIANSAVATVTNIDASIAAPSTCKVIKAFAENNSATLSDVVYIANSDIGTPGPSNVNSFLRGGRILYGEIPVNSSQVFTAVGQGTPIFTVWVTGYYYER